MGEKHDHSVRKHFPSYRVQARAFKWVGWVSSGPLLYVPVRVRGVGRTIAFGWIAEPEEIADAALLLASNRYKQWAGAEG